MTRKSGQRSHDDYGPSNAHEPEVFLSYEAVVDRLEDVASFPERRSCIATDSPS